MLHAILSQAPLRLLWWAFTLVAGSAGAACESSWPPDTRTLGATPCCDGQGTCVASDLVERRYTKLLSHEGCTDSSVCLPGELQATHRLPTCKNASTGAEGRCMPGCLPALKRQSGLMRDDCREGQLCVPCYDPVSGAVTGACAIGDDTGPDQAPLVFASCCESRGRCVPAGALQSLSQEQQNQLGPDTCSGDNELCVPSDALERGQDYVPARCTSSLLDAEGRCLPACLPALAMNADKLRRDGCAAGELCAPCYDPLTGKASGSCSFAADPGPSKPFIPLETCCNELGKCLPSERLPGTVVDQLGRDKCSKRSDVCAPAAMLEPNFVPEPCTLAKFGIEGRCLPGCLPALAGQSDLLERATCAASFVCAPCFNPLTGKSTGACNLPGDAPQQSFTAAAGCCSGIGLCLPRTALPDQAGALLGPDSCEPAQVCAPRELLEQPSQAPSSCTVASIGAEGRCLPSCLPDVRARAALLEPDGCQALHLCVPCNDPISGESLGSCTTQADTGPQKPPVTLPQCCSGLGRCTPGTWVPMALRPFFGADECQASRLCVAPVEALRDAQSYQPPHCIEPTTQAEGRCLPSCLPPVAQRQRFLAQGSCDAAERCVPCYDPISGAESGACRIGADPGPSQPRVSFAGCCSDTGDALGLCVPKSLAPPSAADALPVDRCKSNEVCAPRKLLEDPSTELPRCTSLLTTRGVCVASCFLPPLTPAGSCAAGQACAPCSQLGSGVGGC